MTVVYKKFLCTTVLCILTASSMYAQSLTIKAHIPWTSFISDFEFYHDGIFLTPYNPWHICYFTIDDSFNLYQQYTMTPYSGDRFCIHNNNLFALISSYLITSRVSDTDYQYLDTLNLTGSASNFDPIIYLDSSIICHFYPGDYYRINVADPAAPFVTGRLLNTDDVCTSILSYQDTLLITSRQAGMSGTGNIRLLKNNVPDTLISLGIFCNRPSYTGGMVNINSMLFTAHYDGLVVYDIADLANIHEFYFYPTSWARNITAYNNYIFMSCNDGWHVFKYVNSSYVIHLQYLPNDYRALWMKIRPGKSELWSFVDGGSLAGLVIFDISDFEAVQEPMTASLEGEKSGIQLYPNPSRSTVTIKLPENIRMKGLSLEVYNIQGRLTRLLTDPSRHAFLKEIIWDGKDNNGDLSPEGIYFIKCKTPESLLVKKLVLLR